MWLRPGLTACLICFAVTARADAQCFDPYSYVSAYYSYYEPVAWLTAASPVYYDSCWPYVALLPPCTAAVAPATIAAAPQTYATPTPAPPSSTGPAASPGSRSPGVSESRSFYSASTPATRHASQRLGEPVAVNFWNLSDRELALIIEGQAHVLAPGQKMRSDVDRQFVWRVEGRDPQFELVPAGMPTMEIVIRR
jgi:hypothetical protein